MKELMLYRENLILFINEGKEEYVREDTTTGKPFYTVRTTMTERKKNRLKIELERINEQLELMG